MTPEWIPATAANWTAGRAGQTIRALVNHEMQGTLAGTIAAFRDPRHAASAHYGIGADGRVVQFVADADMAWANGPIRAPNLAAVPWIARCVREGINPNALTLALEWEGAHAGRWVASRLPGYTTLRVTRWWVPTDVQYAAGVALMRALVARHAIPVDRAHICRHSDFDSVTKGFCPGRGFPMARLIADLGGTL